VLIKNNKKWVCFQIIPKQILKNHQQFTKFSDLSLNQENPDIPNVLELLKKNQSIDELTKSLAILETAVKSQNKLWDEIVKESNCEIFAKLIISTPHEEVREKMMSLIKIWAFMFKDPPKYCALEVSFFDFLNLILVRSGKISKFY
jgi:hypothetical protein